jgi:hypothetical protein
MEIIGTDGQPILSDEEKAQRQLQNAFARYMMEGTKALILLRELATAARQLNDARVYAILADILYEQKFVNGADAVRNDIAKFAVKRYTKFDRARRKAKEHE